MNKKLRTALLLSTRLAGLALLLSLRFAPAAFAQTSEAPAPAPSDEVPAQPSPAAAEAETAKTAEAPAAPTGIRERANLFGDMGGLRPWLGQYGITLNLQETSEYLNNLSGGTQRGGAYDGLTQLAIGVDLEKAVGLTGGSFNVSALQIHGTNLTTRNLKRTGNLGDRFAGVKQPSALQRVAH
ncbi:carbohydrate porin, partial [Caballeronia sp. RCC_10]|uniref:carbohydrate porin n=1 Tax=Caballeronia sp. RCC_10 TaxID=3239227 RepID=UPI003525E017